jgi:hypothetical protein
MADGTRNDVAVDDVDAPKPLPIPETRQHEIESALTLLQTQGKGLTNKNIYEIVGGHRGYVVQYMKQWRAEHYQETLHLVPVLGDAHAASAPPPPAPQPVREAQPVLGRTRAGQVVCLRCRRRFESPDRASVQLCRQCCTTIARQELGFEDVARAGALSRQERLTQELTRLTREEAELEAQMTALRHRQQGCQDKRHLLETYLAHTHEHGEWPFFLEHVLAYDALLARQAHGNGG